METLIAKALEETLGPYKVYFTLILIIYALVSFGIQMYFNHKLTKRVELFKNDLKKSEIKFSRHSELQIGCLKMMYNNVVDLHFEFVRSLSTESANHIAFKRNFKHLLSVFSDNMDYFHRNKILLTDDIIEQVRIIHTKFKVIENEIEVQLKELLELEEYHSNYDPQVLYISPEGENESLTKRIDTIKAVPDVITFEKEIKAMRDLVEKYFRTLI